MKKPWGLIFVCAICCLNASAQTVYPTKPVKLMVGAGAGGGTDIIARMLAEKMSESLKGTFVVENKPGASNTIAADLTAKSAPDGTTLVISSAAFGTTPSFVPKLPYDIFKDFEPITILASTPQVLVAPVGFKANSFAEALQMARSGNADAALVARSLVETPGAATVPVHPVFEPSAAL